MTVTITVTACHNSLVAPPWDGIVSRVPHIHVILGDGAYVDRGYPNTNGSDVTATSIHPDVPAGQAAYWLTLYDQQFNETGPQQLFALRAAGLTKVVNIWDDHGKAWNNADWTPINSPMWDKDGGVYATPAQIAAYFKVCDAGGELVRAKYFDNPPPSAPNGDAPSALAGYLAPSDIKVEYFYWDIDRTGQVTTSTADAIARLIFPDLVRYKDPYAGTDGPAKTTLGTTQKAWLKAVSLAAKAAGIPNIFWVFSKNWWTQDNADGMKSYTYERAELWQFIEDNDLPVIHITGDRHTPHSQLLRTADGAPYNGHVVCMCPFGSDATAMVQVESTLHWDNRNDAVVYGVIELDADARAITLQIVDAWPGDVSGTPAVRYLARHRFGERLPYEVCMVADNPVTPNPTPVLSDETNLISQRAVTPIASL